MEKGTYMSRDDTSVAWRSKKLRFWRNPEDRCNWLNSVSWVLTEWGHVQKSRIKVNDQGGKITLWELERGCQLIVRLKANKYY